jgi:type VI secretion system protein VasD
MLQASLLTACASAGGGPVDKALELVGLKKPEPPAEVLRSLPSAPRRLALRLHAGELLNTDAQGRSLAIVARVYRLKASGAFLQLPYEAFSSDRPVLTSDVIDMRELTLTPGQRHEVIENLPPDATHLAVVALFRAPAEQRWRFVFELPASAAQGITLGLHGCAMSVAEGAVVDAAPELRRLAGVRCRADTSAAAR